MYTETITQRLALGNGVAPQTLNNARLSSDGVDLTKSKRAIFILSIGANAGSISAWLQESADNSGWSDLAGSNVSVSGKTASNKIETFEVRADQLSKRYARLQVTETVGANALVCCVALGEEGMHKPNNVNNGTHVDTQSVVA